ncbi:hypothetical protein [uncultured Kordia sp.]|uniref:hypothetical protein n=1 Tax=uncultured Kordia sp. TaxID=507699 RepID=UPI0026215640|nr:hypothetical protein [uncultured Kordia sp.]
MKKKNLSLLTLRKNSISNLNFVNSIKGKGSVNDENPTYECVETQLTYCETCATMGNMTSCITNDTTRGMETPTFVELCNAFATGELC